MKHKIFTLLFFFSALAFAQVHITNSSHYVTGDQMLLANEINESGEPWAEELGYNLDDLDPFIPYSPDSISYTLGINNYEYSRYQLGTIVSRSGMGLHMIWAPVIGEMASMMDSTFDGSMTASANGYKEDDMLMKNIMHFSMLANQMPPKNPWPQFAEFTGGDPHLPQAVDAANFGSDFSTLRWDRSKMEKVLNPYAMGQTLMKQYLWAQDMLSAFHDSTDGGIDADGTISPDSAGSPHFDASNNVFYGGDALDGFIGMVLTAEAVNKVKFLITQLAYDGTSLGMVDPMTYDPANGIKYFPAGVSVTETMVDATMPPKPTDFQVVNDTSRLEDQISLLWGTINFKNMMDPNNSSDAAHLAYKEVFDGDPFPADMSQTGMAGPYDLMKGASAVIFKNIMAMHWDTTAHTFVNKAWLGANGVEHNSRISTAFAGYTISILKQVAEEFAGTPIQQMAADAAKAQAEFLLTNAKNSDGTFANYYLLGSGADSYPVEVETQAGAIRGLYAAYDLTSTSGYLTEANAAYSSLIDNFYVPEQSAFYTTLGEQTATYTPVTVALLSGALRSASLSGDQTDAPQIYTDFFLNVANAMQLSEAGATGESGGDSDGDGIPFIPEQTDGLPPIFAAEAELSIVTGIEDENFVADRFELNQNYPNPFNPSTVINYTLGKDSEVSLKIFNALGQEVATLVNSFQTAGVHKVNFGSESIRRLSSGIYFYTLRAGDFSATRKMMLLK